MHFLRRYARRIVYLDELVRLPVLRAAEMSPDQLALAAATTPPPLSKLDIVEAVNPYRLHPPTMRTDWSLYTDPVIMRDLQRAAQLLKELLLAWRKRADKCPQDWRGYARWASEFVATECAQLERELREGNTDRWGGREWMYGEWWGAMTDGQKKLTEGAFDELKMCSHIHPLLKKEILGHVCSVISKVHI